MSFIRKRYCRPGRAIALTRRHVGGLVLDEVLPHRPPARYRDRFAPKGGFDDGRHDRTSVENESPRMRHTTPRRLAHPFHAQHGKLWCLVFACPLAISFELTPPFGFHNQSPLPRRLAPNRSCRRLQARGLAAGPHMKVYMTRGTFFCGRGGDWFWNHE